jgi:hypothetical protein
MSGFDKGLFGTSEGVMKDYTGYFYNKGNLDEYN